jgi:hypothetical protein
MRDLRGAAACLALAFLTLPARAVEEPPRPPTSALGKIRDLAATVRARRLLEEDRVLRPLNLGVSVDNGVVSVWGPVPSQEVARLAVAKLETIRNVTEVRPNFYLRDNQPPARPERVATAKPEFETGRLPLPPEEAPVPAVADGPKLLAPRRAATAASQPVAAVVKLPKPAASLAELVNEARQSEARFREIAVEVRGQAVLVRRGGAPGRDVMDLVQVLRRIRGVSDVILTSD